MNSRIQSLRLVPDDWLAPLKLAEAFGRKPDPLEVDLGCGKGRFLVARAAARPEVSFLGIDGQLLRVLNTERKALKAGLTNIRLFYIEARYAVKYLLPARSVTTFYVFFPDPWPKRKHTRHRLFDADFLDALHNALVKRGCVHIATDHVDYFQVIHRLFLHDPRFAEIPAPELNDEEQTDFEQVFRNQDKKICRCSFRKSL